MNIHWDAKNYQENFSFVPQYGEDVMSLITAGENSLVVDLGCGNGTLTKKLSDRGYRVIGIDASREMLDLAEAKYPELRFVQGNALSFALEEPADVIFSNAVFHWIDADLQERLARNVYAQLTPGGELVCEFGGNGCAEAVHSALEECFRARGLRYPRVFYFPTIGEYVPILEKCGFRVETALLFDRPTLQQSSDGVIGWINMFVTKPFESMQPEMKRAILEETEKLLKPRLCAEGSWFVDYVRIRIRARKPR